MFRKCVADITFIAHSVLARSDNDFIKLAANLIQWETFCQLTESRFLDETRDLNVLPRKIYMKAIQLFYAKVLAEKIV
jgi:hypothetical protein